MAQWNNQRKQNKYVKSDMDVMSEVDRVKENKTEQFGRVMVRRN